MQLSFSDQLLSCRDFTLDDKALALIPERNHDKARQNAEEIEAADFEYIVSGKKYNGFYARLKNLSQEERHPVAILNRGGLGAFGTIDAKHIFSGFATSIIKAGYIVIGSQRMGFADDGAPDMLGGEDFQSVLKLKDFIDKDDMADSMRIGLYCASHGAIATFRLLSEVDWIQAAVVISGSLDLVTPSDRQDIEREYERIFGPSKDEREKRSAMCWPEKLVKNVPILLMYGTSDWRVDPRPSLHFSEKLINLKVPHRLVMFEGNDHFLMESWQESRAMAVAWLDRFVRNGESAPNMEPHGN
jgi:dipeptidyl aminopeptidase/acylaminoacyl peptidase